MSADTDVLTCKSCGQQRTGRYCSNCGQAFATHRLTVSGMLHDAFHLFTHLDKGFGFTLKQLIIGPGSMQVGFVAGDRTRYQKPFSMFVICASIDALLRYWIFSLIQRSSRDAIATEAAFVHQYLVLLYAVMMPAITALTWLFFRKSRYNFAELAVLQLYTFSFFFIAAAVIGLLKLAWLRLDTAYIELPVFVCYSLVTFIHFFYEERRSSVIPKSIALILIIFVGIQYLEDYAISVFGHAH